MLNIKVIFLEIGISLGNKRLNIGILIVKNLLNNSVKNIIKLLAVDRLFGLYRNAVEFKIIFKKLHINIRVFFAQRGELILVEAIVPNAVALGSHYQSLFVAHFEAFLL